MVISEAGHHRKVEGMVYVAAFQPDKGEDLATLAGSKPQAAMSIKETADGKCVYLDPAAFAADFAADLLSSEVASLCRKGSFNCRGGRSPLEDEKGLGDRGNRRSRHQSGP
ncbi:hypothetical protein BHMPCIPO_05646 [Ensifer sesbaniae]|nr:hypothetical protein [Ensifer sesbaniae]